MTLMTRKLLDKAFSGFGLIGVSILTLSLLAILTPLIWKGSQAFIFKGTAEHRRVMLEQFGRGNPDAFERESREIAAAKAPLYAMMQAYDAETRSRKQQLKDSEAGKQVQLKTVRAEIRKLRKADRLHEDLPRCIEKQTELSNQIQTLREQLKELARTREEPFKELTRLMQELFGPAPGEKPNPLLRMQYGQTRWDLARKKLHEVLYEQQWDYSNPAAMGTLMEVPRVDRFRNTPLEPFFDHLKQHFDEIMRPKTTFYWQFITDTSKDAHIFGGIWPEVLGTIYLTLGAMLFAIPMGIIAAIYLCEYADDGRVISFLRICISTLAGVPSIVFGLFGLAFFLNTLQLSDSKSVLAGSLTLSLLILPTIIRSSEEAILAVPASYKEAALGLGSDRWHTIVTVILPAALPGILTGIIISMGRAAGETAPIIFTAAVSFGPALKVWETLSQPTPALSWSIYSLCTEHEAVEQVRHVQYGMVLTLISIVLLLNLFAVLIRARVSKGLRG